MTTLLLSSGELLALQGRLPHAFSVKRGQVWISFQGQDVVLDAGTCWQPQPGSGEKLLIESVGGTAEVCLQLPARPLRLSLANCA